MKVKRLHLQNYGRFEDLTIDFAPTSEKMGNVTVIVGNNGAGKSQVLQALATNLSWFVAKLASDEDGFNIDKTYINNGKNEVKASIRVDFNENNPMPYGLEEDADWSITSVKDGRLKSSSNYMKLLTKTVRSFRSNLTKEDKYSLPLITFYSVNRTISVEIQKDIFSYQYDQLDAYKNCLNSNSIVFSNFLDWFRNSEDIENERKVSTESILEGLNSENEKVLNEVKKILSQLKSSKEDKVNIGLEMLEESKYKIEKEIHEVQKLQKHSEDISRDLPLFFVKSALKYFTGFTDFYIRRKGTATMIVEKDGEKLDVNQLSQGEKSLLALVGDIARRLAILNPSLANPLEGEGVVMIDEVDLHLHPKWQHDLIDKLVATFPNVQFILTTHSPHVISDRNDILLYSLDDGELTEMPNVYGEDANTVLTKIFDVDIRDSKVEEQFNVIRRAISKHDYVKADTRITELAEKLPSDHLELLKCRLLLAQAKLAKSNKDESNHAKD